MTAPIIALLVALGAGAWIYSKMMHSTGGIAKTALIVAGTAAFFLFIIFWFIGSKLL